MSTIRVDTSHDIPGATMPPLGFALAAIVLQKRLGDLPPGHEKGSNARSLRSWHLGAQIIDEFVDSSASTLHVIHP